VVEVRWLCFEFSKNQAKTSQFKLLYGIRTIRLYGEVKIEKHGKIPSCYEKNISQEGYYLLESIRDWMYSRPPLRFSRSS
jgi:hypothetical protein